MIIRTEPPVKPNSLMTYQHSNYYPQSVSLSLCLPLNAFVQCSIYDGNKHEHLNNIMQPKTAATDIAASLTMPNF